MVARECSLTIKGEVTIKIIAICLAHGETIGGNLNFSRNFKSGVENPLRIIVAHLPRNDSCKEVVQVC